jgi:lipopolysaccharide export LptBFGC system permease protein LptF
MKIWQRHLFFHFFKPFLFFLISFFALYVAIDFSINGMNQKSFVFFLTHYFFHFSKLFDLFVSTAFLFAAIWSLVDLNDHRELLALQMASLSKLKLLSPLIFSALGLFFLSCANAEYLIPSAEKILQPEKKEKVSSLVLKDNTEIVYQIYKQKTQELFDLFWIRSSDDLWYIQTLKLPGNGYFVDHLVRNEAGNFYKKKVLRK